jgi:acetyl esterase/lipase
MKQKCARKQCRASQLILLASSLLVLVQTEGHGQEKAYEVEEGVIYSESADHELMLDIAWPAKGVGPFPVIMFLPGNGWGWWKYETRNTYFADIREAAKRGYVAVAVDYRLTSEKEDGKSKFQYPTQLYDVKCATRWLRANAARYSLNPNHIGAIGFSSGAHLALLLGLTIPSDGLEGEDANLSISSQLQAVVCIAAPVELESVYHESTDPKEVLLNLIGCTPEECPEKYRAASPINFVRKGNPPVLIVHGDNDVEIPVRQALMLDMKMDEVGTVHELEALT